jgi:hypothetical protein
MRLLDGKAVIFDGFLMPPTAVVFGIAMMAANFGQMAAQPACKPHRGKLAALHCQSAYP